MANLIVRKGKYQNEDAVDNVLRYITRTRINENRANELYSFGGMGIDLYPFNIDTIIYQFKAIQDIHNIKGRGGRRIVHEVYTVLNGNYPKENERLVYETLDEVAKIGCSYLYNMGFQVVYAVHISDKNPHIHFAINSISFRTGLKFHMTGSEIGWFGHMLRQCTQKIYGNKLCMINNYSIYSF